MNHEKPPQKTPNAAILLIGNELLSGKIQDENAFYLSKRLRTLGVSLERILVIPDQLETIAKEVLSLSETFDHVFTSGGVGPTHDDVTLEGVALGFNEPLILEPQLHQLLQDYFKDRLNEAHLRMAMIPEGSTLLWTEGVPWPVYTYRNLYILPGVPQVFRAKFEEIAPRFRGVAFHLRSVYLNAREGEIAALLSDLESRWGVSIGSYPNLYDHLDFRVRVTIESQDAQSVDRAVEDLVESIERICQSDDQHHVNLIVRVDDPLT